MVAPAEAEGEVQAGAARRRPGRPRDEDLDAQLIAATLAIIDAREEVTVTRIVTRSGVSRAALYRRWPSLTSLIAAALDAGRSVAPPIPVDGDLYEAVLASMFGAQADLAMAEYPEERFRHRIRLVMADRALQKAYWRSHVARRREPIENAIRAGIERGLLRADLDVEATFDAIAGAGYYQLVARGQSWADPIVKMRLRAAFDVIWRGMLA